MNKLVSASEIKENDTVRVIDGCFEGKIGKVTVIRKNSHYPYLVSLENQELVMYYDGQIEKYTE